MQYTEINMNAEKVASAIYKAIGSRNPSILELVRWMEDSFGIRIRVNSGRSEGFHAVTGLSGLEYYDAVSESYRVWYRDSDCPERQNFTIVHELGHIFLNSPMELFGYSDGDVYNKQSQERFCNRFSAAFLMPKELFIEKWNELNDDVTFKKFRMVSYFKVSGDAVFYRAKELNLLS